MLLTRLPLTYCYARSPEGLDRKVVRSMHRLFGKGYASGGGHLRFQEREGFCRR